MASIGTNYDPATTAQALAQSYTASQQQILERQRAQAAATEKALSTLGSALSTFQTSLASIAGLNKTMAANSALFSDTSVASATATATAAAGTYSFFVEQLASAHQMSYSGVKDIVLAQDETMTLKAGNVSFDVNLKAGTTSVRDLAAAINGATGNTNISASVVTVTGSDGKAVSELVLSSKLTGAANAIAVSFGSGAQGGLATSLGAQKPLVPAQDAIIRIGSSSGSPTYSATNTFNVIDGVTMTVSKAQAAGSAPVTLTVGPDSAKTTANIQSFVDAYNTLKSTVDALLSPGDPANNKAAGAFANDSGVRSLRDRLVSMVRGTGATSLAGYGIIANREGTLSIDSTRLAKALAANPTGLDTLIGSASASAPSGIAGNLQAYLKTWTTAGTGQIGTRKDAVSRLQTTFTDRQSTLDRQYDSAYTRYLAQFTQLQAIQSSMSNNTSLFDAMFSSNKD